MCSTFMFMSFSFASTRPSFILFRVTEVGGSIPAVIRWEAGHRASPPQVYTQDQPSVHTPVVSFASAINLTCITLDCRRNPDSTENTPTCIGGPCPVLDWEPFAPHGAFLICKLGNVHFKDTKKGCPNATFIKSTLPTMLNEEKKRSPFLSLETRTLSYKSAMWSN